MIASVSTFIKSSLMNLFLAAIGIEDEEDEDEDDEGEEGEGEEGTGEEEDKKNAGDVKVVESKGPLKRFVTRP